MTSKGSTQLHSYTAHPELISVFKQIIQFHISHNLDSSIRNRWRTPFHYIVIHEFWPIPLKGQSNEIFDPQFFSSFKLVWATYQWV